MPFSTPRLSSGRRSTLCLRPTGLWHMLRGAMLLLAFGCGSEDLMPPPVQGDADLYWDLALNHRAVVLATAASYDTLRLVATPRNFRHEPLAHLPAPQYHSADPSKVSVTADGMLVARARTSQPVAVTATLTAGNLRHSDVALVSVVEEPPPAPLASLSVHPIPPDSAKVSAGGFSTIQPDDTLPVRAVAADGAAMPVYGQDADGYLPVYFESSDTMVAYVYRHYPIVHGTRVGTVTISATTTAFGVMKVDTLPYRIGMPVSALAVIRTPGNPQANPLAPYEILGTDLSIGVGGVVVWAAYWWQFYPPTTADTIDITFDDNDVPNVIAPRSIYNLLLGWPGGAATFCSFDCDGSGNITLTPSELSIARRFVAPGVYTYRSVRKGLAGRVVVVDER